MPTNADMIKQMTALREAHHIDNPVIRGLPIDITWETFNVNHQMTASDDGSLTFKRSKYAGQDAAIGTEAISSGRHEWTVTAPNVHANSYVGVARGDCDKTQYPAGTTAFAMYLHDGDLCSGCAGARSNGTKNPKWAKQMLSPIPLGTPIHVILDMEVRASPLLDRWCRAASRPPTL